MSRRNKTPRPGPPPIASIPFEILSLIAEQLFDNTATATEHRYGHDDRLNFRLVCKGFDAVVRRDRLFQEILISDYEWWGRGAGLEHHPGRGYVTKIQVTTMGALDLLCTGSKKVQERILSQITGFTSALHVHHFPTLADLTLQFPISPAYHLRALRRSEDVPTSRTDALWKYICTVEHREGSAEKRIWTIPWTRINETLLAAVSSTALPSLTSLTLAYIPCRFFAAFASEDWKVMLGRLRKLTVGFVPDDAHLVDMFGVTDLRPARRDEEQFLRAVCRDWFPHLRKLEGLVLRIDDHRFRWRVMPHWYAADDGETRNGPVGLPRLQELALGGMKIEEDMLCWILEHSKSLVQLTLRGCEVRYHLQEIVAPVLRRGMRRLERIEWVWEKSMGLEGSKEWVAQYQKWLEANAVAGRIVEEKSVLEREIMDAEFNW